MTSMRTSSSLLPSPSVFAHQSYLRRRQNGYPRTMAPNSRQPLNDAADTPITVIGDWPKLLRK